MNRLIEILLLLLVCGAVFAVNIHRHDYIKTEALRAVVVSEMLARPGLSMPTVHEGPYLKKPPLYAWTTTTLARALGRFDEQVARIPSAACATLFIMLMYLLGERWIGRGGGVAAAVLALFNPTVMDYGARAELDLPFSFFCAACIALTITALRGRGATAAISWLAAYALALIAGMWKGPHSLIFMWLTMAGYMMLTLDKRVIKSPFQWIGLIVAMGTLAAWAAALSSFAGPAKVGRAAGIELLVRLVPHKASHFIEMLTFIPILAVITIPASIFGILIFNRSVRYACGFAKPGYGTGDASQPDRFRTAITVWLIPSLIFMMIAPAKSPRYTLPIFAPVFLLGAWVLIHASTQQAQHKLNTAWRCFFTVLAAAGLFALIRCIAGFAGITFGIGAPDQHLVWLVLAVATIIPLICDLLRKGLLPLNARLLLMLVVILGIQPVLHYVWWPARVKADTQRQAIAEIETIIPEGQIIYVLGVHEYPDNQLYSSRQFRFIESANKALEASGHSKAWCICRAKESEELLEGSSVKVREIYRFRRTDHDQLLLEITPGQTAIDN